MNVILDLLALGILGLCVWNGYRKGFIMSLAGVVILVAALALGGYAAENYSDQLSGYIEPYIGWLSTDAADTTLAKAGAGTDEQDETKVFGAITDTFEALGISSEAADGLAQKVDALIREKELSVKSGIARVFTQTLTYILVFLAVFAVAALVLTVFANIISAAFGLPVLNAINKIGGITLGAVYGFVLLFAMTWLLRFTGVLISQELLEKTWFVRVFMYINPIRYLLGL